MRGSQTNFREAASIIEHVFVIEQRRPALVVPSHCTTGMLLRRCGKDERNKQLELQGNAELKLEHKCKDRRTHRA